MKDKIIHARIDVDTKEKIEYLCKYYTKKMGFKISESALITSLVLCEFDAIEKNLMAMRN